MLSKNLSFTTLLLMISFASVNAVLFTPALPAITHFFAISNSTAQQTITWFLIGYALGQLMYGPLANRFGRKPALYIGIMLQISSSLICVLSGILHEYWILVLGRFLLALGSSVGLKMTFTLVNEYYKPKIASQKISYLMLAFAITPGLGVALGGFLTAYFDWSSCFYAGAIYGCILLFRATRLPETQTVLNLDALKLKYFFCSYAKQFKNSQLILCGLLMGSGTCFVYIFAAAAPFIAMNLFGMHSSEYGIANLLPTIGLVTGSLFSAQFSKKHSHQSGIQLGILFTGISAVLMLLFTMMHSSAWLSLFSPMIFSYFGLSLVFANASTLAMNHVSDKAQGSAVMNFINMGSVTVVILGLGFFTTTKLLLPLIYIFICIAMVCLFKLISFCETSN